MTTLGHPEWVAISTAEYVEAAVALAANTEALAARRTTLRDELLGSGLCNAAAFTSGLEDLYDGLWMDHVARSAAASEGGGVAGREVDRAKESRLIAAQEE